METKEKEREGGREKKKSEGEKKHLDAARKNFQLIAVLIYKRCKIKIETCKRLTVEIFIEYQFFKIMRLRRTFVIPL